ncbi:GroES-like protein [Melanomma pulvis-pyrius CBS 109.77]|uniref:GroES-like protein n=1 Tax=Melanomma pulvis-pyrius CBS 109.77 TaxID=1314802 RepID=A0A6A6XEK9_9PLEO|nr:GroES-like protein [Melanomma pulvis-pyrius CBS 109.77]
MPTMSADPKNTLPLSHSAIVQDHHGRPRLAEDVNLPVLKPGTVMVETIAVALNPSDNKMGKTFPTPGAIVGMDFSGIVVSIHPETTTDLVIGDRVCGCVHGSNPSEPTNGAFAEHVRARPELLLRVPDHLPMEHAATLGTGLMTNIMALWHPSALGLSATLEAPAEKAFPVLVYGGSTATGTLAIQLLRLSGLEPTVACSPHNFDLVQSRGATSVTDYMSPDALNEVRSHTQGRLKHAYDCIVDATSISHCYKALGRTGGRYISLEMVPKELQTRRAVRASLVLAYEGFGENVALSKGYESQADPEKLSLMVKHIHILQRYLDNGTLKTHPARCLDGGLAGILEGLRILKSGSVSGQKLAILL